MFVVRKKGNISNYSNTPSIYNYPDKNADFVFLAKLFSFSFKNEVFSEKCAEINEKMSIMVNMNFSDQPRKIGKLRERILNDYTLYQSGFAALRFALFRKSLQTVFTFTLNRPSLTS